MIGLHQMMPSPSSNINLVAIAGQQPNIVRVAAKTAPQIVSSVPKCRKGSRSRRAEPKVSQQLLTPNLGRGSRAYPVEDQVLLIVNDDPLHGGGVPVIGRRLPTKSMSALKAEVQRTQHMPHQLDYPMAQTLQIGVDYVSAQPVMGRRKSRNQQFVLDENLNQPLSIVDTSMLDNARDNHQPGMNAAQMAVMRRNRRLASQSVSNLGPNHQQFREHQRRPSYTRVTGDQVAQTRVSSKRSDLANHVIMSSSCTSLCCAESPDIYLAGLPSNQPNYISPHPPPTGPGYECCPNINETADCCGSPYLHRLDRSVSCQREPPTVSHCLISPNDMRQLVNSNRRTRHSTHYEQQNELNYTRQNKITSQQSGGVNQSQTFKSEERRYTGRVKPAAPKPPHSMKVSPNGCEQDEVQSAAVSQMYESLAAELKAKLGDPKIGPILLPPKDYDTMSRKQGKLNGIELRRSTNPQLVGPAVNRGNLAIKLPEPPIVEGKQLVDSDSNTGSARSSSRSSQDPRSVELQRSCSNSSSGLGSISIGDSRSPNSCSGSFKASSSEDVAHSRLEGSRQLQDRQNGLQVNGTINTSSEISSGSSPVSPVSNFQKSYSPDDIQSSDSGLAVATRSGRSSNDRRPIEINKRYIKQTRGFVSHHPDAVSSGILWNGRVEVPLKINSEKNGNTYLATKQIIY